MEVDVKLIGMVKINTKGFYKETIEKLKNYWPGGSYLVLRSCSSLGWYSLPSGHQQYLLLGINLGYMYWGQKHSSE